MKKQIIEKADLFTVYKYNNDGTYFVDIVGSAFAQGFDTLQGVAEHLYYQGFIQEKTVAALNAVTA